MIVLNGTTSTGQSAAYSGGPFTKVAIEIEGGPGTVTVEGRVGAAWSALIASSTFTSSGLVKASTTNFVVSSIRANVSAWGSTTPMAVHLLGA